MKTLCSFRALFGIAVLLATSTLALAFTPPRDTAGPLTVSIADPGEVKALEKSIAVPVTLANAGDTPLSGVVRVSVTDDWRVESERARKFTLAPNSTQTLPFSVVAGAGTYAALYPVHARVEFRAAKGKPQTAHAILILSVAREALAAEKKAETPAVARAPQRGPLSLLAVKTFQTTIAVNGKPPMVKPAGWQGSDTATGCSVGISSTDRGETRHTFNVHPPYRGGWGDALMDFRVALPKQKPVHLDFATAIRDSNPKREGASDGVDFRVLVSDGGEFKQVFARFSAAKSWEPARVDLSDYAGREITLRLFTGPGPAHNTSCDSSFWAEPTVWVGAPIAAEPEDRRAARRQAAVRAARAVLTGDAIDWAWKLTNEAATVGAAVVAGPNGLADAFIAFVDDKREVVFDGFTFEVDGLPIATSRASLICDRVEDSFSDGRGVLDHYLLKGDQPVRARAKLWTEKGALRVMFSMPGVKRDKRGEPRFTQLMLGPASEKVRRVYAGFGNVIQDPGKFDLRGGGFTLSTRHVGADFAGGLSLVQAVDIFPDFFRVDPETRRCSLVTHHDATFSLVPSQHGAFAAARVYRTIANFKPAGGVAKIQGRICLDQWGGDYREAANGIEQAARYGLTDAVFVKHVWQRWGYDYRLPDICPPAGNQDDFMAMVTACKRNGILFCPHDNYIDFYPDAEGYSYDHIIFNADGTPQKAWFNKGRDALSYRWLPTAFQPWLDRNLRLMKRGFGPTSCFVDVFTAIPPVDFYDRAGRFYPKMVSAERWGAAFDRIRAVFGNSAPQISEAGHDGLIGHLDAGQSDHSGWMPGQETHFNWRMEAGDAERVPWHDMASHGAFVLLAGGLGHRYSGETDQFLHGYASDDYLSNTVIGGRNPMCDGPFSRRAVMTYWLLHDVCEVLARREMLSHEFAGDDIHRQSVKFAGGAAVHSNRGMSDWQVDGATLPRYGFIVRAGDREAGVTRRDGVIAGFARKPGELFADARPEASENTGHVEPRVLGVEDLGNGRFRLRVECSVAQGVPDGYRAFVHFIDEKRSSHEGIVFQGNWKLDAAKLATPGTCPAIIESSVPESVKLPATVAVRCGFYHPGKGGSRLAMRGAVDGSGRARCGRIEVKREGGRVVVAFQPEPVDPDFTARQTRVNSAGKVVDFGPVATNGAFRLRHGGTEMELTPLPSTPAFQATLRLDRLDAAGKKVERVVMLDNDGKPSGEQPFSQKGDTLQLSHNGKAFGYRIRFAK
ncbi:MAG: NEW3 domain-containing protein [Verrucomicrobiia bacterium]